jgi:hypothetical protein
MFIIEKGEVVNEIKTTLKSKTQEIIAYLLQIISPPKLYLLQNYISSKIISTSK